MTQVPVSTVTHQPSPLKKYFLYVLIGGLVLSAFISIAAILVGEFSEVIGKSLLTTFTLIIHSLLGLAVLSSNKQTSLSGKLLINVFFGLIVASLLTSILGVWNVIEGVTVGDLYATYLLVFMTTLIVSALLTANQKDPVTRGVMWTSIATVCVTTLLILPYIFADSYYTLPTTYGRITWAFIVLAATLSVLTAVFDRLYAAKHPELKQEQEAKPGAVPTWLKVLLIVIAILFGLPLFVPIFALFFGAFL